MARYLLTALVSPLPGQMDAYKHWHETQHVPEVLRVPGFLNAVRYEAEGPFAGGDGWSLMSLYEIETDDIDACMDELKARLADGRVSTTALGDPNKRTLLSWKLLSRHEAGATVAPARTG